MKRLVAVEARRLLTRRLVRAFLVLAMLNVVIASVWVFAKSTRDMTGAVAAHKAAVQQCLDGIGSPPPPDFVTRNGFCERPMVDPRFHLSELGSVFGSLSTLFVFAMWVSAHRSSAPNGKPARSGRRLPASHDEFASSWRNS